MSIGALIFDLDGVIANTLNLHLRSWQILAAQYGHTFNQDDLDHWLGWRRRECLMELFSDERLDENEINRRLAVKNQIYLDLLRQTNAEDLIFPGTLPLFNSARQQRLKIGVASSSLNAYEVLLRIELFDLIDVIADGGTVARPKPYPDIFVWTAGALRTTPECVIVFEDSAAGVSAAHTAGMFVVGIGLNRHLPEAHLIVSGLGAMALEGFLQAAQEFRTRQLTSAH
jgi:beta-phosphoglucomutase